MFKNKCNFFSIVLCAYIIPSQKKIQQRKQEQSIFLSPPPVPPEISPGLPFCRYWGADQKKQANDGYQKKKDDVTKDGNVVVYVVHGGVVWCDSDVVLG